MYTLRIILKNGMQMNACIGKGYNYVGRTECSDEFNAIAKDFFKDLNKDVTYAYIVHNDGADIRPLYKDQRAYMMLDGKTVDRFNV